MVGKTPRCFAGGAAPGLLTLTSAVSAVGLSFRGAVFVYPAGDASGDAGGAGSLGDELPDIAANGGNGSGRTVSVNSWRPATARAAPWAADSPRASGSRSSRAPRPSA